MIVPWEGGRSDEATSGYQAVFDEELRAAGFKTDGGGSLFETDQTADLQVGVLIDDVKGRFCRDCPNLFQRDKVTAVVTMNARWELYSTARSAVIARVTTSTGATIRNQRQTGAGPILYAAFRENVRVLLASEAKP